MTTNKTTILTFRASMDDFNIAHKLADADGLSVSELLLSIFRQATYTDKQRRLQIKVVAKKAKKLSHLHYFATQKRLKGSDIAGSLPDGQIGILAYIPMVPTVRVPAKTIKRKKEKQ